MNEPRYAGEEVTTHRIGANTMRPCEIGTPLVCRGGRGLRSEVGRDAAVARARDLERPGRCHRFPCLG